MSARKGGVSKTFLLGMAVVIAAALVVVGTFMKRAVEDGGVNALTAGERLDLREVDSMDGTLLEHPELGFWLKHPGPLFAESREAEEKLAGRFSDPSTRYHAWADMKTGQMLYLTVSKRPGLDVDGFEHMLDTVADVFSQQTVARLGDEVPVDTVDREVEPTKGRASVHRILGTGEAHVRVGAWKSTFGRDVEYVIMVAAVTMQNDALKDVVESFSVAPRR